MKQLFVTNFDKIKSHPPKAILVPINVDMSRFSKDVGQGFYGRSADDKYSNDCVLSMVCFELHGEVLCGLRSCVVIIIGSLKCCDEYSLVTAGCMLYWYYA